MQKNGLLTCCFCLLTYALQAQPYTGDSALVSTENNIKDFYDAQRSKESAIYNGRLHYGYSPLIEGIGYFETNEWFRGDLVYGNVLYKDTWMRYDLVTDQVIITADPLSGINIALFSPRIQEFGFSGLKFVYFSKGQTTLSPGFYQQLAEGELTLFVRISKILTENIVGRDLIRKFEEKRKYYILRDNQYYLIKKKNDLLDMVKEERKAVQDHINKQGLRFRSNPQQTLLAAVQLYNQRRN